MRVRVLDGVAALPVALNAAFLSLLPLTRARVCICVCNLNFVQELPAQPIKQPNAEYKHLLFVYPQFANFSTTNYRNIACEAASTQHKPDTNQTQLQDTTTQPHHKTQPQDTNTHP